MLSLEQQVSKNTEPGEIVKYVEIDQDTESDEEEEESIVSDNASSTSFIDESKQINVSDTISVSDDDTLDTNYNSANIETTAIVENNEHDIIDINSKDDKTTKPETVITNESEEISEKKNVSDVRIWLGNDMKNGEKIYWEFGNKNLNNRHLLISFSSLSHNFKSTAADHMTARNSAKTE